MFAAYVMFTCLAALFCAYAVYLNVTHDKLVTDTARRLNLSMRLMIPFGILLGLAGAGLLAGFALPVLGTVAATGMVGYFVIALATHLRMRDFHILWPFIYLLVAVAALVTGVAHHGWLG